MPSISHAPESPQVPRLAAIYARVSTTDQADKGYSLPKQIDACLAYAQAQGYRVEDHRIFTDDFTGVSLNRPALQQLRALMHTGAIHALICFEQDRLSRKLAHQLMLADEAEECGVTVHFTAVPASERTPETQLFTNITGAFHEYDRLRILKRTRDGLVGRAKAGYAPGGRPPLGYRYVKHPQKGGYYEVHAKEAALVREIFALYTTDGLSIGDIARRLTVERVPTCQDRRTQEARKYGPGIWYTSAVARILSNTAYIGTIHWDKYERQTSPSNPDNKTGWRKRDSETWQAIPVPALIDEALFQAAQARKSRNLQEKPRNKKHEYLLSNGRPRCGVCGYTMAGRVSTSPRTGVFIAVAGRSTSPSCVKGISRLRRSKSRSGRPSNGSYATPR